MSDNARSILYLYRAVECPSRNVTVVETWTDFKSCNNKNYLNTVYNKGRKEGNVLFNDALNTFYLRLYGVKHMVKDHSDSERGNPLPPHGLLFPINSKGSFLCIIPHTG